MLNDNSLSRKPSVICFLPFGQFMVLAFLIGHFTASKHDAPAMEVDGHGVFTILLLEALKGGAADVTGHITLGGVYAYIDRALGRVHAK